MSESQQRQLQHVQLVLLRNFPGMVAEPAIVREGGEDLMQFTVTFRGKTETFAHPFPVDRFRSDDWASDNAIEWVQKRFPAPLFSPATPATPTIPVVQVPSDWGGAAAAAIDWAKGQPAVSEPAPLISALEKINQTLTALVATQTLNPRTVEEVAVWLARFYGGVDLRDLDTAGREKWLDDARRVMKLVRGD